MKSATFKSLRLEAKIVTDFVGTHEACRNQFFDQRIIPVVKVGHTVAIRYATKIKLMMDKELSLRAKLDGSKSFEQLQWSVVVNDSGNVKEMGVIACSLQELLGLGTLLCPT